MAAFSLAPGLTEVTMFGGCPKWILYAPDDQLPKIAETTMLRLGEHLVTSHTQYTV